MRLISFIFRILLILGIPAIVGVASYKFMDAYFFTAANTDDQQLILLDVKPNSSFKELCLALEKQQLIRSWWVMDIITRLRGASGRIQPGEYKLSRQMTPTQIFNTIVSGEIYKRSLAISPGVTLWQIATAFQDSGLATREQILPFFSDPQLIVRAGIRAESLEGYLAPGTYKFSRAETIERMIWTTIEKANKFWTAELLEQAGRINLSKHEIVTLASLIEALKLPVPTRKLISSVYHNRLDALMLLKSEASLRYGLGKVQTTLNPESYQSQNIYNSFVHYGLPPTPINNPSKESIIAALYPENTNYYHFRKNNDKYEFSHEPFEIN